MTDRTAGSIAVIILGTMLTVLLFIFLATYFNLLNERYIECLIGGGGLYCWAIDQSAKNLLALIAILVTCGIGIFWYILSSEHI